jgi:hypothetical protein
MSVMELLFMQGIYALLARMMQSCRIDFDPEIPNLNEMLGKFLAKEIEEKKLTD